MIVHATALARHLGPPMWGPRLTRVQTRHPGVSIAHGTACLQQIGGTRSRDDPEHARRSRVSCRGTLETGRHRVLRNVSAEYRAAGLAPGPGQIKAGSAVRRAC